MLSLLRRTVRVACNRWRRTIGYALGGPNRARWRFMPWLVALGMLAVVVGLMFWVRQQDTARRVAEGRADAAEARSVVAEASLTAIARTSAAATATALAETNQPEAALRRALDLVFEAYKDPIGRQAAGAVGRFQSGRVEFRAHRGGAFDFGRHCTWPAARRTSCRCFRAPTQGQMRRRSPRTKRGPTTRSTLQNRKTRCVREESEQTYMLHRVGCRLADPGRPAQRHHAPQRLLRSTRPGRRGWRI